MTQTAVLKNRRAFLGGALATTGLLMTERSAKSYTVEALLDFERRFAPVNIARNRIIREVVGLRPYRAPGFVVQAQRLGRKLLIHNYGHGGAGVTLSWGTAALAVDRVREFPGFVSGAAKRSGRRSGLSSGSRPFAVLGCGVNGLSTALLLQRRYQDGSGAVTIYAKDLPPDTTSNVAGAFWHPTSVYDPLRAPAGFAEQFRAACRISHRAFQTFVGPDYGVRWMDTFELLRNEAWLEGEPAGGADLYPQTMIHRDPKHYFGFPIVRQFSTMIIEPQVYLRALLRDFYSAGGRIVVKEFRSRDEVAKLAEPVVFNCTGLGAADLFDDEELIPVRGQLEVLLPQPEIDYCYIGAPGYMFPRRDGIILGGTWDHGVSSLAPNPEQTTQIIESHAEIMKALPS